MLYGGKTILIGDRVRITDGVLKGLKGVVSGFGSLGNPILHLDGLFNVMVGTQAVETLELPRGQFVHN